MMTLARVATWFKIDDVRPGTAPVLPPLSQRVMALANHHPIAADTALAVAVAGLSVNMLRGGGSGSTAVLAVFAAALALPLVWRRRYPVCVFAVVCAAALAQWIYAQRVVSGFAILVVLYSVARHAPRRVALAAAVTAEAVGALAGTTNGQNWFQFLAVFTAMIAAPYFLGSYLRTRQAYLSALEERARRLEHERDQQAQIAAAAERASIAREMHDIVAHSLAVIITMAEAAAAKRRSDPERAGTAMEQVAETGREALDQTRRVLGVLRPCSRAAPSPLPGLDQLDALLGQVRAIGLTTELSVTGRRFPVRDDAQLAVYRIIQEALTNTIRHAHGATRVQVQLQYAEPVIEIDITDDGQPPGTGDHGPAGHGLAGMRERAALYGGAVIAGPRSGGGWRVSAGLSPAARALPQPAP
jgi:signal transduction histidine kinase